MKPYIKNCYNVAGGQYALLENIFAYFPDQYDRLVDLFAGSGVVGINNIKRVQQFISTQESPHLLLNDIDEKIISFLDFLLDVDKGVFQDNIDRYINLYNLSNISEYRYSYYGVTPHEGVAGVNRKGFDNLKRDYNKGLYMDDLHEFTMFYILMTYSYNRQPRLNHQGEYNASVGKRDFTRGMRSNLYLYHMNLHRYNSYITLTNKDFRDVIIKQGDFVYSDPPNYFKKNIGYISWGELDQLDLYMYLDRLNMRGVSFLHYDTYKFKGVINQLAFEWMQDYEYSYIVLSDEISVDKSNNVDVVVYNYDIEK